MRTTIISLFVAGVAISLCAANASAETAAPKVHRHHHAPRYVRVGNEALPLTVNKRSFLDPGPVAPVTGGPAYLTANTIFLKTPDQITSPDKFGNSELQGQPYVPGRTVPVAEFATGPNVGDLFVGPLFGIGR
ncbi:MAG: hypothetical protein ABSA13_09890 [Beijerinckiaceae bacterium]|jgi:hypothetical protein